MSRTLSLLPLVSMEANVIGLLLATSWRLRRTTLSPSLSHVWGGSGDEAKFVTHSNCLHPRVSCARLCWLGGLYLGLFHMSKLLLFRVRLVKCPQTDPNKVPSPRQQTPPLKLGLIWACETGCLPNTGPGPFCLLFDHIWNRRFT